MHYIFLTSLENPNSGLLSEQLFVPVRSSFNSSYSFLNIRHVFRASYKRKEKDVKDVGIFLVPARHLTSLLPLLAAVVNAFCAALVIGISYFPRRRRIWLCARGYVSGIIALFLRKMFGIKYSFDPRSLYILEQVGAGRLTSQSLTVKVWIRLERSIISNAEKVTCVSKEMVTYYRQQVPDQVTDFELLPCFSGGSPKKPSPSRAAKLKKKLGFDKQDLVCVYFGSLDAGWNNINLYEDRIKELIHKGYGVVIVSQNARAVRSEFSALVGKLVITCMDDLGEFSVAEMFEIADYGLLFMDYVPDWKTRLSVKFANYCVAGLPVLVSSYVGEATRLVKENKLEPSIVLSSSQEIPELVLPSEKQREHIASWGLKYFALGNINRIRCGV